MLDEIQTALTRVPPDLLAALKIQALSEKGSTDTPRTVDSDYVCVFFFQHNLFLFMSAFIILISL